MHRKSTVEYYPHRKNNYCNCYVDRPYKYSGKLGETVPINDPFIAINERINNDLDLYNPASKNAINRNSHNYIKWLQRALNKIMKVNLDEDGILGTKTRRALRSFQRNFALKPDGIPGPRTEAALIQLGVTSKPSGSKSPYTEKQLSCEPGKFKRGRMRVVTWKGRTVPGRRRIPKHIKLAILARGRIRVPTTNVQWLIELHKDQSTADERQKEDWVERLPQNFNSIFPEVDVTTELFINNHGLTDAEASTNFHQYLLKRHQENLSKCKRHLFFAFRPWSKKLIEGGLATDLTRLYKKAGVPLPKKMQSSDKKKYFLLVYISFPNEIIKHLEPKGKHSPRPKHRRVKFNTHEKEWLRKVINKVKVEGNKDDQVYACILQMLLRDDVHDRWIPRHQAMSLLFFEKDKLTHKTLTVSSYPIRREIIWVIKKSKNWKELFKKLILEDPLRPHAYNGLWVAGGPVLRDFIGTWNMINGLYNSQGEIIGPNIELVRFKSWLEKRTEDPKSIFKCLI